MINERPMYFRRDGTPYDPKDGNPTLQWAADHEDIRLRRVCFTRLWWGGHLSTVWLGLDHGWMSKRPIIFESMLFTWAYQADLFDCGRSRRFHPEAGQWRYATEKQAIRMHSALVRHYRWPWRCLAGWAWDWFKSWERENAKRTNTWSLFTPFLEPEFSMRDLMDRMNVT
jgi:hypothetical protein